MNCAQLREWGKGEQFILLTSLKNGSENANFAILGFTLS